MPSSTAIGEFMINERQVTALARKVVAELRARKLKIVLAESCTGGLASAVLTRIPGVSEFHCGSAVVYQIETKAAWLHIPRTLLRNPGPVSPEVVSKMALGALAITPHADVAAAITGHLGPDAPKGQDGLVYVSFARRKRSGGRSEIAVKMLELSKESGDQLKNAQQRRMRRQKSAAVHLLTHVLEG